MLLPSQCPYLARTQSFSSLLLVYPTLDIKLQFSQRLFKHPAIKNDGNIPANILNYYLK
jgi:hypothetical protein